VRLNRSVLITDDIPSESDLRVLVEAEQGKARLRQIEQWVEEGHILLQSQYDITSCSTMAVLCLEGDEYVVSNKEYPSEELVARLALAIAAGRSQRNYDKATDYAGPVSGYARSLVALGDWKDYAADRTILPGYRRKQKSASI
jgi:hypothetical protein